MQPLNYVTKGDKASVVISQASDLLKGKMKIGESVNLVDELINTKNYFSDFLGENSKEFKLAKEMLSIVSMINRSIRLQKESEKQTLEDWITKFPIRAEYVKKLESLVSSK